MNDLGLYLRQQREGADLSLRELGLLVGVSKQYLHSIELGDVRPSAEICTSLAQHLQLDADAVLLMAGHVPPDVLSLLQENPRAGCALLRSALAVAG